MAVELKASRYDLSLCTTELKIISSSLMCSTMELIDQLHGEFHSQHVEVPVPSPKKGEVLLKMEASNINPIDWKIQKGMSAPSSLASSPSQQVTSL